MKKSRKYPGASIRNTQASNVYRYCWFEQKQDNGLHYNMVYEKLDELSGKGFLPFQILQILELGEKQYTK